MHVHNHRNKHVVPCADGGVCVCPYIDTHILMVATYVAMSDP